jgi:hypothetical protein
LAPDRRPSRPALLAGTLGASAALPVLAAVCGVTSPVAIVASLFALTALLLRSWLNGPVGMAAFRFSSAGQL